MLRQVEYSGIVSLILAAGRRLVLLHGDVVVMVIATDLIIARVLIRSRL